MKISRPRTYSQFIQLPLEQRKKQFKFFSQKNQNMIPVLLSSSSADIPELKNCKFLIRAEDTLMSVIQQLRQHIRKNCNLKAEDQLFFYVKSKILNQNQKSKQLYQKINKQLLDGWMVITYTKQATFGSF